MLPALIAAGANIVGGIMGANSAKKQAELQYRQQKEFAQNGIQWKVDDARKAGVHPLYALGANTHSFAPVSVGDTNPLSGLAAAGQDVSRAVDATRSTSARVDAYTKTAQALQLQRMGLENELLGSQIAKIRQSSQPAMPTAGDRMLVDGQGDSPLVRTSPMARQTHSAGAPSQEAGAVTEMGYLRTPTGWAPVMSKDAKDRTEDDIGAELAWSIRNRLFPMVGAAHQPPSDVPLAPDEYWKFNSFKQEYYKAKRPKNWLQRNRFGGSKWEG